MVKDRQLARFGFDGSVTDTPDLLTLVDGFGRSSTNDPARHVVWEAKCATGKTSAFVRSAVFEALVEVKVLSGVVRTWAAAREAKLNRLEAASNELGPWQRKWIAKGIREWEPLDLGSANTVHELAHNTLSAIDLSDHLVARHLAESRREGRSSRRRRHGLPEWLRIWLPEAIRALIWGAGKKAAARVVAPKLGPQAIWTDVSTHVDELGRQIERLANTIFPHAPTSLAPNSIQPTQGGLRIPTV